MTRFVLGRLGLFAVALLGISVVIFTALRILPGDMASVMAGISAPPEQVARLRVELGLNRPLVEQYGAWLYALLRGDFGVSMLTGRAVSAQVAQRAAITLPLIAWGLVVALGLGLPLGVMAVLARRRWQRSALHAIAIIGGAVPALWSALLLIMLFARGVGVWGVLPSQGFARLGWQESGQALASLVLPGVAVGIIVGAGFMRYTRAALQSVLDSDALRMAMACGMTLRQAALKVGLRLAAPQLVSVVGLAFAHMITGVMVVENVFALPGLGNGLVTDVGNRDLLAAQSELLMLAMVFLLIGGVVDMLHRVLDPRLIRGAHTSAQQGQLQPMQPQQDKSQQDQLRQTQFQQVQPQQTQPQQNQPWQKQGALA